MLAGGIGEYLFLELFHPRRARWKMDSASLDRCCLSGHSHDLIPLRGYADSVDVVSSEVLDQAQTRPFFLDNEGTRWRRPTPAAIVLKYCPLQVWMRGRHRGCKLIGDEPATQHTPSSQQAGCC